MPGVKTNEVAGTRAVLRHYRMSAYKARQVLDLIRGKDVDRADEILRSTPREAARVVGKVLASAVANARNNDQLDPEELYVSACYADEGTTLKRWRPRARGRATRIRKRTCHITVIVSRLPEDRLERRRARQAAAATAHALPAGGRLPPAAEPRAPTGRTKDADSEAGLDRSVDGPTRSRRVERRLGGVRRRGRRGRSEDEAVQRGRPKPTSKSPSGRRRAHRGRSRGRSGRRNRRRRRRSGAQGEAGPGRPEEHEESRRRGRRHRCRRAKRRRTEPWARRSTPTGSASA